MVLAAGSARRFGATKQLARWRGRTLVEQVVATASSASSVDRVVVVVGHDGAAVAAVVSRWSDGGTPEVGGVEVVANPDHMAGQASSLRVGLAAAEAHGAAAVVVLLADEPEVTPAAVDAVVAALGGEVVAARAAYDDGVGHPVALAASTLARLRAQVRGDRGAGPLLADLGVVEVPVAGVRPRDVDHPADLPTRAGRVEG